MAQPKSTIPILDLKPEIRAFRPKILKAMKDVLDSAHFILGPNVAEFEREFAAFVGVEHAVGVNSGTDAIVIGLRAAGVGPGDEVITTAFSFFATSEAIHLVGATPVYVDIDPGTFNLDAAAVEAKIAPRTKAILPVHLYGHACDMDPLLDLARKRRLRVIEDVAQACGGRYRNRSLGALGDVGAFSFFPSKTLGAFGDGGMITTNHAEVARVARMLRAHGSEKKYRNEMLGYNSRLDELQAAILRVKLKGLARANAGRRRAAKTYERLLSTAVGITAPKTATYAEHVFHQYTVRVLQGRDEVQKRLAERGIQTMVYYPVPLHRLPYYREPMPSFPESEEAAATALSLPIWPQISAATQKRVVEELVSAVAETSVQRARTGG